MLYEVITFNIELIDAISDIVPAIKPQCAYYEMYGYEGIKALKRTIEYAKSKGKRSMGSLTPSPSLSSSNLNDFPSFIHTVV